MSGALIVHLEDIFDELNEKMDDLTEIRDGALTVRDSSKGHRRDNRVFVVTNKTRALPLTESRHENYGWLEQYVDCKLEESKRKSIQSGGDDPFTWNRRRDVLPGRELSLTVEQKDGMEKPHQRCVFRPVPFSVECDNAEKNGK
jgi:hypothetical protein